MKCPEPRRRLGGIGTPTYESFDDPPSLPLGLPDHWVTEVDLRFEGVPPDPANMPVYESEASYLKRYGLLEPGEEKRLTARSFRPEVVQVHDDDDENDTMPEVSGAIQ